MRTRSTSTPLVLSWHYKQETLKNASPCAGWIAAEGNESRTINKVSSTITDTLGRKTENPCTHLTITDRTPNPGAWYLSVKTSNSFENRCVGAYGADFDGSRNYGLGLQPPASTADIFAMYSSMLPGIKSEMDESIANFVIDLPQVRSIPSMLPKVRNLRRVLNLFRMEKKVTSADLQSFVRWVSGANLGIHFGIIPLIDDLKSIYRSIYESQRALNRLKAEANKWRVKHCRFNGTPSSITNQSSPVTRFNTSCSGTSASCSVYDYRILTVDEDIQTVKIRYRYRMPDLPDWLAKTYAAFDTLGLSFNPKIIWDATRLSFVVDWFLKVGTFLNQFNTPSLNLEVEVYSCVHSRKLVYRQYAERRFSAGTPIIGVDRTVESYERFIGTPPYSTIKSTWGVSWFKAHIGASLLVQKLLR